MKKENTLQAENVFYSFVLKQSIRFGYSQEKLVCYCDGLNVFLSKYPEKDRNEFLEFLELYYSDLEVRNLFGLNYTLRLFHIFIEKRKVLELVFQIRTKIKSDLRTNPILLEYLLDNCFIPDKDFSEFSDKLSFVVKAIHALRIDNSNFDFYKELIKVLCDTTSYNINHSTFLTKVQINKKLQFILHCFLNFKKQKESIEKYIQFYKSYSIIGSINFDLQFIKLLDTKLNVNYIVDFNVNEINKLYELYKIKPFLFKEVTNVRQERISAFAFVLAVFENYKISILFLSYFFEEGNYKLNNNEYEWFIDVLNGKNLVYSKNLPFKVTKKVAHIFSDLPLGLPLDATSALVYAAFLNHNVRPEFALAIVRKVSSMKNIDFWIETLRLLHNKGIETNELMEVVDYIQFKVFRSQEYVNFKTISLHKLRKDVEDWHNEIYSINRYKKEFTEFEKSDIEIFDYCEEDEFYQIIQLLNTKELFLESSKLKHCVVTYNAQCAKNFSLIFSLRKKNEVNVFNPLVTIEVKRGEIVQKRGLYNRKCTEFENRIIRMWANENKLKIA